MVENPPDFRDQDFYLLFADDQAFMLTNLKRYFKNYYNVLTASTLEEARQHMDEYRVGIVVSDHQMAEGHGLDLLQYVVEQHPITRRVIITADRTEGFVIDMINKGLAHSFAYKPTVKDQLHVVINEQATIFSGQ